MRHWDNPGSTSPAWTVTGRTVWRAPARPGVVAAVFSLLAVIVSGCGTTSPSGVATVARGSVQTTIDAVGTLQYLTQENLSFPAGSKLVALKVKVGDRVVPGQPIAEIDNTEQRMRLRKAQDEVTRQQAILDSLLDSPKVSGSKDELDKARDLVDQQGDSLDATDRSNKSGIGQATRELSFDKRDLADKQQALAQAQTDPVCSLEPTCIRGRENDVQNSRRRVLQSQDRLRAAEHRLDAEHESHQANIDQAQLSKSTSNTNHLSAASDLKPSLDAQRAVLDEAQAEFVLAQKAVDATTMHSNFNGSVFEINGEVGHVLNTSVITPLTSTRDNAALPAAASAPAQLPSVPLVVIKDLNAYQVSAPFGAIDAMRMKVDQPAEITFDAVPGLTRRATVSSITPVDASVKETTYIVKLNLTESDPRLSDGMTTRAHVIAGSATNVLVVPASAVHLNGQSGRVTVVSADGSRRDTPVELGATGADTIQVISGLGEGEQVLLPDK